MLRIEHRVCRQCGKSYTRTSGGVVSNPQDLADENLCPICRAKELKNVVRKIKRFFE